VAQGYVMATISILGPGDIPPVRTFEVLSLDGSRAPNKGKPSDAGDEDAAMPG
jgi:hypothetical protein